MLVTLIEDTPVASPTPSHRAPSPLDSMLIRLTPTTFLVPLELYNIKLIDLMKNTSSAGILFITVQ